MTNIKHTGEIIYNKSNFEILNCNDCGFIHAIPLPTAEILENIYINEYYSVNKPNYIDGDLDYAEWWKNLYELRYTFFDSLNTKKNILDIGSGPGLFLEVGNARNWDTTGIEPNIIASNNSIKRGLNVINSIFDKELSNKLGKFGVINLSLVLEHILDPINFLKNVYNNLDDNGLLCLIVPNDFNPLQEIFTNLNNEEAWWVSPPHHINYFNFNSTQQLLKKIGFEIIQRQSTFPLESFLLMGLNYVKDPEIGKKIHKMRVKFELSLIKSGNSKLLQDLYTSYANLNIGREVYIVAKKVI
jgi:SAM-dependent methyltransferase